MMREAAFAGLIACAAASGAQAACPEPPALTPTPLAPSGGNPSWAKRAAALKAERAWAEPRTAYGACRRAELQTMAERVNALTSQANAIVEEWNVLDRKVRAARSAHAASLRAYTERRAPPLDDLPAPRPAPAPSAPCAGLPSAEGPPAQPDPASASAGDMNRANATFANWLALREDYLVCRKAEGVGLIDAANAAKARYEAARKDYVAYRKAFNASVAGFEASIETYTRELHARKKP